jgi:hypothetical protein
VAYLDQEVCRYLRPARSETGTGGWQEGEEMIEFVAMALAAVAFVSIYVFLYCVCDVAKAADEGMSMIDEERLYQEELKQIREIETQGHTYHCACRQVWGDGECECLVRGGKK